MVSPLGTDLLNDKMRNFSQQSSYLFAFFPPQHFMLKIFKPRPKFKDLHIDHLFTQHLDSVVKKLLLYLLYHMSINPSYILMLFKINCRHQDILLNTSSCI